VANGNLFLFVRSSNIVMAGAVHTMSGHCGSYCRAVAVVSSAAMARRPAQQRRLVGDVDVGRRLRPRRDGTALGRAEAMLTSSEGL